MLELPVLAILVNFDTLLYCTRTIVDTKEYSISNVFSACSGVTMVNGVMKVSVFVSSWQVMTLWHTRPCIGALGNELLHTMKYIIYHIMFTEHNV